MIPTEYNEQLVSRAEFEDFKIMTQEKFFQTDKKIDHLTEIMMESFDRVYERFDGIDKRFEGVDEKFVSINQRFEKVESRLDVIDKRLIQTDEKIENLTQIVIDGFDMLYDKMNA